VTYVYFVSYNWIGPNGSGTDWVVADSTGPIDSGQEIYNLCLKMVADRPDYTKVTPLNIVLLKSPNLDSGDSL